MPVTLTGFLVCRSLEEADRVSELLPEHIRTTRAERGCVRYEVWRSRADPVRYAFHGVFTNRATYGEHLARSEATLYGTCTRHIPRDFRLTDG
jgi:quinol monooxygenase YgiN